MPTLKIKRVYQEADKEDGKRILIDRLWPRGVRKADAKIDLWLKDIAPSPDLRKWFNHDPQKWKEFCKRYHQELNLKQGLIQDLLKILKRESVTFLYGAKDEKINHAAALKEYLEHPTSQREPHN